MITKTIGWWGFLLILGHAAFAQVDTTFIYRSGTPFGTLDLRIAKSATRYYYLQEGKTFSFRESEPGVKTDSYRDMTSWDSSPYTQGNLREKNGNADAFIMNYRLLFPVNYNADYSEGYPLIIMVHGLGERGNCWDNTCHWADRSWRPTTNNPPAPTAATEELLNNDHNLLHGGSVHLQMRNAAGSKLPGDPTLPDRSFPGFVLFPQNLNGWDASQAQDAIKITRLLIKKYKIDQNRIYIHGLSNGGAYVYEMTKRAPWLFAAAAPMSAVTDGGVNSQGLASKVANIPFWIFQGGQDTAPSPARTDGYVKKFREAGWSVRYTKYENIGHGTWNNAYNEPDFFSWLRSKSKSQIHVFADNPTLCNTTGEGVKMELAEGFLAYQWERNGVIISGANAAGYTATTTGTYRARFSRKSATPAEDEWNHWSDPVTVVSSNPAQAQVAQTGTLLLKDLNYYGYAHLSSVEKADHYYWYKNGTLVNLSGNEDDTVRYPKFSAGDCSTGDCAGNGAYTLVTAGFNNCPSPPSEPKYIFFNNQAPVNITAPTAFTGSASSESTASLNWTDASSNENGFEIWRRKKTGTSTYSKWVMANLANANTNSFNDSGLEPSSTYQYKIRAVSNSGRSDYTPSSSSQFVTIVTLSDNENPTTPQNLAAASTAIKEITLTWQPSTDNTGIREYLIYYGSQTVATGSAANTFTLTDLPINTTYSFTVSARDLGGNLSGSSNAASGDTFVNGLYYQHTTGAFTDIDLIDWSFVEFRGKVNNFTLTPRTQEDYFNFQFEGYLYITSAGSYQFQTTSDDGSRLSVDSVVLVDNDGLHGTKTITGNPIVLGSGGHFLNVQYFENAGSQNLTVKYKGPDTGEAWISIPDAALRSGNSSPSLMAASVDDAFVVPDKNEETFDLRVYPNPLGESGELTISANANENAPVVVKILDFMGNTYYEKMVEANELTLGVHVTPSQKLNKGLYIVTMQRDKRVTRKILMVKN